MALGHEETASKIVSNLIATYSGTFLSAATMALVELVPTVWGGADPEDEALLQ